MTAGVIAGALVIGFAAGVASGALGVGGGLLFVPGLVLVLGETQIVAESTSLLAIVPVAVIGTWRQRTYGNLRMREAIIIGLLSPIGVVIGTVLANNLPERSLKIGFAVIQIFFAYRLARRAIRPKVALPEQPSS